MRHALSGVGQADMGSVGDSWLKEVVGKYGPKVVGLPTKGAFQDELFTIAKNRLALERRGTSLPSQQGPQDIKPS